MKKIIIITLLMLIGCTGGAKYIKKIEKRK